MKKSILGSLRFLILSLVVFGGIYTAMTTGIGQLLFSNKVNGSLVSVDNHIVGSKLIGQRFESDKYFSGRADKVSQLSPISEKQKQLVAARVSEELARNPSQSKVPNDLVTASASGVDPDISLSAAKFQADRISKNRGLPQKAINDVINKYSQKDWFSNRYYVNVLQLNIALDKLD